MEQIRSYEPTPLTGDESDGVAIVSGGMDSITMVYNLVLEGGLRPHLVSFDYGQRHRKELDFALWNAEKLGLRWSLIDLTSLTDLIATSALTSPSVTKLDMLEHTSEDEGRLIEVPEGHYAEDNMRLTVVPNRNMMMMAIGTAICVSNEGSYLAAGMHAGDHFQYPDCRAPFVRAMNEAIHLGNEGFLNPGFDIITPWIGLSKNDIAAEAFQLQVPLNKTWSCYKGGDIHCGRCGTCVERLEAIDSVGEGTWWDKTEYADVTYWRQAVANAK
jgi:7-cyano-7-deazaguanine synthase